MKRGKPRFVKLDDNVFRLTRGDKQSERAEEVVEALPQHKEEVPRAYQLAATLFLLIQGFAFTYLPGNPLDYEPVVVEQVVIA